MENSLSPIVLFTYRRIPKETIESLLKNDLSKSSELYIFSDGYKSEKDKNDVLKVREYLKGILGFKDIKVVESDSNNGLADSIVRGVSDIIKVHKKVIVLEDDLIVSKNFLNYMNDGLNFYEKHTNIWSLSGYSPRLECLKDYLDDVYFSIRASSWGWATWEDRWQSIDWDVKDFKKLKNDKTFRSKFELGGDDMYKMLELQMLGKLDSWAIRWCFSQFLQDKYTVFPTNSKIINNGFSDNLGTHNSGDNKKWKTHLNDKKLEFKAFKYNENIAKCFKKYHDLSLYTMIGYFLKKYGGYHIIKRVLNKL